MQHHRFLTGVLFTSTLIAASSFAACGGNVILDGNTGGNTGGTGGAGATSSTGDTTTVNPVGGSTGDAGSTGVGGSTPVCPGNLTYCPDGCVDILNDPSHCGSCDVSCGGGAFCQGGICNEPNCATCGEYITNGGTLCDGLSAKLYDSLLNCVCAGSCVAQCSDNACVGSNITTACQDCVIDTVAGCGNEFNECANDL